MVVVTKYLKEYCVGCGWVSGKAMGRAGGESAERVVVVRDFHGFKKDVWKYWGALCLFLLVTQGQ